MASNFQSLEVQSESPDFIFRHLMRGLIFRRPTSCSLLINVIALLIINISIMSRSLNNTRE